MSLFSKVAIRAVFAATGAAMLMSTGSASATLPRPVMGAEPAPTGVAATEKYFMICDVPTCPDPSYVYGWITWYARMVHISGRVSSDTTPKTTWLQARFQAFAGGHQVGATQTRTAMASNGWGLDFAFDMGDPNLVGGVTMIRVTLCSPTSTGTTACHAYPEEFVR
ncbi:hypothetical protein [Amycolatopsis sp. NPDC059657]|uniref:hypothetical protein n=1 Tax=Amycolatopsis sp. NPDC059657 TaxID=3346899 RepID=UPI0036725438